MRPLRVKEMIITGDRRVDAVIAVSKPDVLFYNCIKRLLKQSLIPDKIIIACDNDGEWKEDPKTLSERIEVHFYPGGKISRGRLKTFGAGFSEADIVVFLDPEVKAYNKYLIEKLVLPLSAEKGVTCSLARELAGSGCIEPERYEMIYYYPARSYVVTKETIKEAAGKISPLGYGCAGFIKSSFDDIGGFEDVNLSPEVLMACALMEKGDRVAYCKDAVVIRSNNYSLIKQFKRYYDIGSFQKKKLSGHGYSPDIKNELRLNVKSAMYLLDYKEYLWLGYDRLYKGAKYLGWLLGSIKGF